MLYLKFKFLFLYCITKTVITITRISVTTIGIITDSIKLLEDFDSFFKDLNVVFVVVLAVLLIFINGIVAEVLMLVGTIAFNIIKAAPSINHNE